MKKIITIIFTGSLLIISSSACNITISQTSPITASPSVIPANTPTSFPTGIPTLPSPMASVTPEFAPSCEVGEASVSPSPQCQVPVAEESSTYCNEKDAYNLILLDKKLTYELLTKGFRCKDSGIKNDRQMVACTGLMATDFEINVCDPACVIPTVQAVTTKCPQGYNYNNLQGCCTQEEQILNPACMVFKFTTTSCVANCNKIVRKSQCLKNPTACIWDQMGRSCKMRE